VVTIAITSAAFAIEATLHEGSKGDAVPDGGGGYLIEGHARPGRP
jgi:hypothetical protein